MDFKIRNYFMIFNEQHFLQNYINSIIAFKLKTVINIKYLWSLI